MFVSFLAYFKTGSCCNLEILWTVNDVPLPSKKMNDVPLPLKVMKKETLKKLA